MRGRHRTRDISTKENVNKSACGPIGVCLYLAGFVLPLQWDIPLAGLGLLSALAIVFRVRHVQHSHRSSSRLTIVVWGFLITLGLSIIVSKDIYRSLRLSTPLLPAVLLFILIAEHCKSLRAIRFVYGTFSLVGLGLASTVLGAAWMHGTVHPEAIVSAVGSPILLVPNDSAFLAVVTPLSLAILCRQPRSVGGIVAALSILSSVLVMYIMQSPVGILTTIVSIACAATLLRPSASHLGLVSSGVILVLGLLTDGFFGFPLVVKCITQWDGNGRIPLWLASWFMFLDAPLLGHGPHTFVLFYRAYLHSLSLPTWLTVDSRIIPWVHNLYLEVLAEQGIVGFTALVTLLICGISTAWNLQRNSSSVEERLLIIGALAGLIGLSSAAVIELTLLRQWVAVVLFALLGVIVRLASLQRQIAGRDQ